MLRCADEIEYLGYPRQRQGRSFSKWARRRTDLGKKSDGLLAPGIEHCTELPRSPVSANTRETMTRLRASKVEGLTREKVENPPEVTSIVADETRPGCHSLQYW
jgi:hypothetical protein